MPRRRYFFLFLIFLGFLYRIQTFGPSVFSHDESTYIIIADAMRSGAELYVDVVDIKAPGIFYLYTLFMSVFSDAIFSVRFFAALAVGLSAWFIFLVSFKLWKDETIALLSGVLYIFLSGISTFSLDGNTEIFFQLFISAGLAIILHDGKSTIRYLSFGILLGCAVLIKQVVLLEAFFFGLVALYYQISEKTGVKATLQRAALYIGGVFLPSLFVALYFGLTGHGDVLIEYTLLVPGRYASAFSFSELGEFLFNLHLLYFYALIPFYIFIAHGLLDAASKEEKLKKIALAVWFLVIMAAIIIPGKFFRHYYFQLFVLLSLTAPALLLDLEGLYRFFKQRFRLYFTLLVVVLLSAVSLFQLRYSLEPDIPREVAEALKPQLGEGDSVFVGKEYHILYYLLERPSPTKYIHPSLLTNADHIQALAYDNESELLGILEKRPQYVITKGKYPVEWVEEELQSKYLVFTQIENARVLIRKSD